jgi:acyl-CoA synthetase (AMP-forming)/AMP-acid ligase II
LNEKTALTLLDLLAHGAPEAPALLAPGREPMTFREVREGVAAHAERLASLGLGRGDRIAVVMENGPEMVLSFLAAAVCGTAVPLNPKYRSEEFAFYYRDGNVQALVAAPGTVPDAFMAATPDMVVIHAGTDPAGRLRLEPAGSARPRRGLEAPGPDDVAILLHTSGTTKLPKRVPIRQRNLAASAANVVRAYALTPDDVSLCVMPLFHIHGIVASMLAPLASGGSVVCPAAFDALRFWSWVDEFRPTWYSAVPAIHQLLLSRADRYMEVIRGNPFRFIRSCSAALPPMVIGRMEEVFRAPVTEAYGMTEATHQMTSNPLPPGLRKPGAVGFGVGVQVAIMDEIGTLLPPDMHGEVVVRGLNVVDGYENNREANETTFVRGWLRTGDQGIVDADGYLAITGRLSERINRGGEKISPLEIDHVLLRHPCVAEALAFGVPHRALGEDVHAAVVARGSVTEQALRTHCAEFLADFKVPRRIHFLDALPYVGSGKLRRNVMAKTLALAG